MGCAGLDCFHLAFIVIWLHTLLGLLDWLFFLLLW